MPLKFSVFISYPHTQSDLLKDFIDRFKKELYNRAQLYVDHPLWYDEDRLKPGYLFNDDIARGLCETICLIALYMPVYEKKPYCLREFMAMERLEQRRFQQIGAANRPKRGMIIPVILRSDTTEDDKPKLPGWMTHNRQYSDFRSYNGNPSEIFDDPAHKKEIEDIARTINDLYLLLIDLDQDPCADCTDFFLPTDADVEPRLIGPRWSKQPFPTREGST